MPASLIASAFKQPSSSRLTCSNRDAESRWDRGCSTSAGDREAISKRDDGAVLGRSERSSGAHDVRRIGQALGRAGTTSRAAGERRRVTGPYPLWKFYPGRVRPPAWVHALADAFAAAHTADDAQMTSDQKLTLLRPALVELGFEVERGKKAADKLRRPVLFGEMGIEERVYEVDAFHPKLG